MSNRVKEALEKYKNGQHVHLGHPNDCNKEPNELMEQQKTEQEIVEAIYSYELERGGIRLVNGLYEYDPEVLAKLPQYRCNHNLWCCIEDEQTQC